MAILLTGKIVADTNVFFIDYLRRGLHAEWVRGGAGGRVRFLSAMVLLELRLGSDTLPRRRAVDRLRAAFPDSRVVAPTPGSLDRAGTVFRALHGDGRRLRDRLGPMNDLLIALTAWRMGATVVTSNLSEFERIGHHVRGLQLRAP